MRIVKLTAENVKRLRAVEIEPDGNTVVIAGRNSQGKSSVLDSIFMALAGGAGKKETSRPIRDGEKTASVELDLGDMIVERNWTEAGTTLHVSAKDGARYPSPQTILDSLIGRLSFDPLAFAEQDAKGQLAMLLEVANLPFDPEKLSAERVGLYNDRTDHNREVKRLEALVSGLPAVPDETPDAYVQVEDIVAELRVAQEQIAERAEVTREYRGALAEEEQLKERLRGVTEELAAATALVEALAQRGQALPPEIDAMPIQVKLESVGAVNEAVRVKKDRATLTGELEKERKASEALSKKIEKIDESKAAAIAKAEMPLEGLSFDDDGVLYQGIPFSQASASEKLRVGIAIAMALNPKIRVIRITDGSLLDSENMALIDQMAAEHDYQVWVEVVDETGTVGITIEDGQVVEKADKQKAAAA